MNVEDICSPWLYKTEPVTVYWGRKATGQEAGLVPGEGSGKSASSDGDLSSYPQLHMEILECSLPTQGSSHSSLFSKLQRGMDTWASWGSCQWRWAAAVCCGQRGLLCVFPEPPTLQTWAREPVHCNSSGYWGYHVSHETDQRSPWSYSQRFLSCASFSSKSSLYQWPQMV